MTESHLPPPADSTTSNSRDAKGRFAPGNAGGPGNPFARRVAQLRAALINSVSEEDIKQIAERLLAQARAGVRDAIKLLFQYVLGKPVATVNPDTLDVEEWRQVHRPSWQAFQEAPQTMMSPSLDTMCGMVRIVQPTVLDDLASLFDPPSPNGNCRPKATAKPSPNGDDGGTKPPPSWLKGIAERVGLVGGKVGKNKRRGA